MPRPRPTLLLALTLPLACVSLSAQTNTVSLAAAADTTLDTTLDNEFVVVDGADEAGWSRRRCTRRRQTGR